MTDENVVKRHFYNRTDGPIIMDEEGRILGGFEGGDYPVTRQTNAAVATGALLDKGEANEYKTKVVDRTVVASDLEDKPQETPVKEDEQDDPIPFEEKDVESNKTANKGRTSGKVK